MRPTNLPTQSTSDTRQSHSSLDGGQIVGIVSGILVLLLLIGAVVWLLQRARRRLRRLHPHDIPYPNLMMRAVVLAPTPFPLFPPPESSSQFLAPSTQTSTGSGSGSGSSSRRNKKSIPSRKSTDPSLPQPSLPGDSGSLHENGYHSVSTSETQVQINELRMRIEELTQSIAPEARNRDLSHVESSPPPYDPYVDRQ
ncbi:hypothetical protein D9758_011697 [Tetrapyrgos nigripes]|uniref:Uncharacterized protein n=1 Tax=Tetrapyrgos nigripes TaxID=182062 RepID=A0A8H5GD39_9AGAR|nr:hypothetical protein D9758_011697 [Tetrapyrgos nigripes]